MLKTFLQSYSKSLPKSYTPLITTLSTHPNLIIHHPIEATPSTSPFFPSRPLHPLTTRIKTSPNCPPIPKGVNILMMSASQSFTNVELIGARAIDRRKVQDVLEEEAQEDQLMRIQEIKWVFRILVQIYANASQIDGGTMPLHVYSKLLLEQSKTDPKNPSSNLLQTLSLSFPLQSHLPLINSSQVRSLLISKQPLIRKIHKIITDRLIKVTTYQQLSTLYEQVRAQMKQIHENSKISDMIGGDTRRLRVLAPVLGSLRESHQPNCLLVGKYFTHLRDSFYCLETSREIRGGEELVLPQRDGMSNYDKLLRLGYKSILQTPQNPANQYLLPLNLQDPSIPQVLQMFTSPNIDLQQQLIHSQNLKLKRFVKLTSSGTIKKQDLKLLRILHNVTSQTQLEKEFIDVDRKIYAYAEKFGRDRLDQHLRDRRQGDIRDREMKEMGKLGNVDMDVVRSLRIVQDGEIQILTKFLEVKKRICGK